jgi:ring-1,2-phenylacetyl-CoA epoxidase subunit PaaC
VTNKPDDHLLAAVGEIALSMADDELILAHRDSEWTGHAPILEEDIAFSNIALDELGHASLWYDLCSSISGVDPDRLVFFRSADEYRNVQMVELPNGDWAFTIARQYLFDAYELVILANLVEGNHKSLAGIAGKIRTEELYHYRHTSNWVRRLGLGTDESNRRTQLALEALWPFAGQLFVHTPESQVLVNAGLVPERGILKQEWEQIVIPYLQDSGLNIPSETPISSPRSEHTEHLTFLLTEMQEIARLNPLAQW